MKKDILLFCIVLAFLFSRPILFGQELNGVFAAVSEDFFRWILCDEQPTPLIVGQVLDLELSIVLPNKRTIVRTIPSLITSPSNIPLPKSVVLAKGVKCVIQLRERKEYLEINSFDIIGIRDPHYNRMLKKIIAYLLWDENFIKIENKKISLMNDFRFPAISFKSIDVNNNLIFNIEEMCIQEKNKYLHLYLTMNLWSVHHTHKTIHVYEYKNLNATVVFSGLGTETFELHSIIPNNWGLSNDYQDKFKRVVESFKEKIIPLQVLAPGQSWLRTKKLCIALDPSQKYLVFYEPTQFTMAEILESLREKNVGILIFFDHTIFPKIIYHFQPQMVGPFFPIILPITEKEIIENSEKKCLLIQPELKLGKHSEVLTWSVPYQDDKEKNYAQKFLCSPGIKMKFESPNIFILQGEALFFLDHLPFLKLQNINIRYQFYYENFSLHIKTNENNHSPRFQFYNRDDDNESNQLHIQTIWQAALNIVNWLLEKKSRKLFSEIDELLEKVANKQELLRPNIQSIELKKRRTSGIVIYSSLKAREK